LLFNILCSSLLIDIEFSYSEIEAYRISAEALSEAILKIEQSTKYVGDADDIQRRLEGCYKKVMFEE